MKKSSMMASSSFGGQLLWKLIVETAFIVSKMMDALIHFTLPATLNLHSHLQNHKVFPWIFNT